MDKDLKLINDLTEDIRKVYKIETPILDMESIVDLIGGTVVSAAQGTGLYRTEQGFMIVISPYKADKKYALAQELGHLFMHMFYEVDDELWEKQPVNKAYMSKDVRQEFRANKFALALLMPYNEYVHVLLKYQKNGAVDMEKVAEHFDVTITQAISRAQHLGFAKAPEDTF